MQSIRAVLMGKSGVGLEVSQDCVGTLPPWLPGFCEFEQVMLVLHLMFFTCESGDDDTNLARLC